MFAEPEQDHETLRASFAQYSTCDVSDALLKLNHPRGGFLPGISLWAPVRQEGDTKLVGPAYTVKFVNNLQTDAPKPEQHYIDTTPSGTVVVISAPKGTTHAVYGGLMSHRARYLGALGTVIDGNLRDLDEHRSLDYKVFARDVATPPFYEVARASAVNVPIKINDHRLEVVVEPGDYIVGDLNGVVSVPRSHVARVLELLPQLLAAEDKVKEDIDRGASFAEATKKHRQK